MTPDRHLYVLERAPRLGVTDRTEVVRKTAVKVLESTLRKHADEIAPEIDSTVAEAMIETIMEALAHRSVQSDLAQARNDTLKKEATRLITLYLSANK